MSTIPEGWPPEEVTAISPTVEQQAVSPVAPGPDAFVPGGPPPGPPPGPMGDNGFGLGMLIGIVVLLAIGAGVLSYFLLRDRGHHAATVTTTVIVNGKPAGAGNGSALPGVVLPRVVGARLPLAASTLRDEGFKVATRMVRGPAPAGLVLGESPRGNQTAARGTLVTLTVSNGAATGKPAPPSTAATPSSPAATTSPAVTTSLGAATAPATSPAATTTTTTSAAPPTTTSTTPPAPVTVPSVTGETVQGAAESLSRAGFLVSVAYVPGTSSLGTVTAESPSAGDPAPAVSHVTVNASSGPGGNPSETVPDVTGRTIPQAVSKLQQAGLRLIFLKENVSNRSLAGQVVAQTPAPGATAPKNAQVLVYMGAYR
jgi:beta-lactam-binding protein with PASTA domain